jgi:hypothetical protein
MGARIRVASKAGGFKQAISATTLPKLFDTTPSEALDQNQYAPLRGWAEAPNGLTGVDQIRNRAPS